MLLMDFPFWESERSSFYHQMVWQVVGGTIIMVAISEQGVQPTRKFWSLILVSFPSNQGEKAGQPLTPYWREWKLACLPQI